jgi:membrane protease YdiL (CAAX protease family)
MRDHHLGNPKTPKSRRTITISPTVAEILCRRTEGRPADDFVFTSRTGLPMHNGDFYTHVWRKLMKALAAEGVAPLRFHDLRHTHVAWLVAGGAPLPHIQARLGHESITTTIDTYGHLLPAGDELTIVARFAITDWGAVDVSLLLVIIGAGVLVGFAEETLFRGIVLRSLRTGGRDEARAALWTAVGFGLFHLPNLLVSGLFQTTQVLVAAVSGVTLYVFRRRWGFILPAMIAHGIWDMSSFLATTNDQSWVTLVNLLFMVITLVAGIAALVSIWRKDRGVVVTPQGVRSAPSVD